MHDISKDVTLSYRSAFRAIIFLSRCAYIYQYEEKRKFGSGTIFNDVCTLRELFLYWHHFRSRSEETAKDHEI